MNQMKNKNLFRFTLAIPNNEVQSIVVKVVNEAVTMSPKVSENPLTNLPKIN